MEKIYVDTNQHYTSCKIDLNNIFNKTYEKLHDIIINNDKVIEFLDNNNREFEIDEYSYVLDPDKMLQKQKRDFELLLKNPLFLFSECNGYCALTRKRSDMRERFEDYILHKINKYIDKNDSGINVTFYGSGYLLQEMIILTKLKQLGYQIQTVNLMESKFGEYLDCMKNDSGIFTINNNDTKPDRSLWLSTYTLRLYHFINYLNYIGIRPKINMFKNAKDMIQSKMISNIFIGIDYIDDGFHDINEFYYVSKSVTKGLAATLISYNLVDVFLNEPNFEIGKQYLSIHNKISELSKKLDDERQEIPINTSDFGEAHKFDYIAVTSEDSYGVIKSANYGNIEKQIKKIEEEYGEYAQKIIKNMQHLFIGDFSKFVLFTKINNGTKALGIDWITEMIYEI